MLKFTQYAHYASLALMLLSFAAALASLASKPARKAACWFMILGFLTQTGLLAARWVAVGYLPVTGLFSALHFLSIWMIASTLYFVFRYNAAPLVGSVAAVTALALFKAGDGDMALKPLIPALDTPLFFLHVAPSFAAYGLFAVAAVISLHRLFGFPASDYGHERRMLDVSIYVGYIFLSWCMIAGSLWAYLAWGSYWVWKIKGLWTTILWFYYSGLVHVRNRGRWQGWPLDVLSVAGFMLVLFTFLGLGLLFETSHPLR